jgi:5-methylthioadenosine/S-adenosylhomocysteine deaminase
MAAAPDILVKGGYVITMDAAGDIPGGDVLVRDGAIAAVGAGLHAPGAQVISASGKIVAPGLVDTHWHLWNTLLRGLSDGVPDEGSGRDATARSGQAGQRAHPPRPPAGYFATCTRLGSAFGPGDTYQGTRLACAEAIDGGITTVHDWAHNIRGRDWAEAGLRALAESGLRARFSYGYRAGHPNEETMDLQGLAAVAAGWDGYRAGGRLSLGMAWRGAGGSNPAMRVPPRVYREEIETARGLGLPVTVHACGPLTAAGQVARYDRDGLLGPDLQLVHLNSASAAEIALAAAHGSPASVSPVTELQIGYGQPVTGALLAAGIPAGLSVDTTMLSGNADMFAIMKVTHGCANALARDEFALRPRDVLRLATIGGARALGLGGVTGSLAPGKRADLIVVSAGAWNLGVLTDPARLLVTAAHPGNVETVIADGAVLKRDGELTGYELAEVTAAARAALAGVLSRA